MNNDRIPISSLLLDKVVLLALVIIVALSAVLVAGIYSSPGPVAPPDNVPAVPTVPETLESATLELIKPDAAIMVDYTGRGFSASAEAAIAWWMNPDYYSNTTMYRSYLRSAPETRSTYRTEYRVFYDFITMSLDGAIKDSRLSQDLVLYRGTSSGFAGTVLNNSAYIEAAYPSTSYDITVCISTFAKTTDGYQNVFVIQRKKGDHALYINEDQREFLLPRDTEWSVVKAVNVEHLAVHADFPLYNSSETTRNYDKVRLIYIKERTA